MPIFTGWFVIASLQQGISEMTFRPAPFITKDRSCDTCLEWKYNIISDDVTSLHLHRVENGSDTGILQRVIGMNNNAWIHAQVSLTGITNLTEIVFKAEAQHRHGGNGQGNSTSVAVDDLQLTVGKCKSFITLPHRCTFDRGMCGWTLSQNADLFIWSGKSHGKFLGRQTGPDNDKTGKRVV